MTETAQLIFKNRRPGETVFIEDYRKTGGYEGLRKAFTSMSPEEVRREVEASGLRGRGGAGFPTGKKWSFFPADKPGEKYLVCNGDEMEPGTYKDRELLLADPHQLVEGMIVAAYALQTPVGYIFIRYAYDRVSAEFLERAIAEAKEAGFLGKNILGSGFSLRAACPPQRRPLHLRRGNGAAQQPRRAARQSSLQTPLPGGQGPLRAHRPRLTMWRPSPTSRTSSSTAGRLVCGAGPHQRGRRHQALRPLGAPGAHRVLRTAHRHPPGGDHRNLRRGNLAGTEIQGLSAGRSVHAVPDRQSTSTSPSISSPGEGRQPPRHRRRDGLRRHHLHGGGNPQPQPLLRPGELRMVHPLPRRTPLRQLAAGEDRAGRRNDGGPRHLPGPGEEHHRNHLLRPRPGRRRPPREPADASSRRRWWTISGKDDVLSKSDREIIRDA